MKYITILTLLLTAGCTSTIKRITSSGFVKPPVVTQPDVVEPLTASIQNHPPADLEQTNDVFLYLVSLVVLICALSVAPMIFRYLKTKWGRYPSDQDNG